MGCLYMYLYNGAKSHFVIHGRRRSLSSSLKSFITSQLRSE